MFNFDTKNKGQSLLEYVTLTLLILGAIIVIQEYMLRGVSGRWKSVGDMFGYGRVYDENETAQCAFDTRWPNRWYNAVCFEENCTDRCFGGYQQVPGQSGFTRTDADCLACIVSCENDALCDPGDL